MTVSPLVISLGEEGPPKIIDLSVDCPTINVAPPGELPPTPPGEEVGAGLGILLGIGLLAAVVMTSKK